VPHTFRPVFDIMSLDAGAYGENPALKIPVLVDERGPLFGTENICHELLPRSSRAHVVMRGDVADRLVTNADEMVLHAMSSEVSLVMAASTGDARPAQPKVMRSMQNSLAWLDEHLAAVLAALPAGRALSFFEVALFCVATHIPFRKIMEVDRWANLVAFCEAFGRRESARATEYRYDAP
jgi:glutathione S-transferase